MSTLNPSTRTDLPMIPVPVFPHNANFLPPGGDNAGLVGGKGQATVGGRGMQGGHMSAGPLTGQEPLQLISSDGMSKGRGDASTGDSTVTEAVTVDPNRLKLWTPEETVELIRLYKKYLPDFHQFGQRKMNVWQRVTEDLGAKGYSTFSWAECSAKFRSLRDSYRRSSTGGRGQTWQYYAAMKDVMKMEKMILEQEPAATRGQKTAITCDSDGRHPSSAPFPGPNSAITNPTMPSSALPTTHLPSTSHTEDGERETIETNDVEAELSRKRISSDMNDGPPAFAAKKPKEGSDQDGEIVIGRNLNGEPVRAKTRKGGAALGGFQALGKNLNLPQTQLVVGEDGQVLQTTCTPTGLYVSQTGQLCTNPPAPAASAATARQVSSMPQWFKLYEKRTRAENSRRLEELKDMHRDSLELQRQTLEVARQKNELLKTLLDSLAQFKALMQR